jgi:hypothetical protein
MKIMKKISLLALFMLAGFSIKASVVELTSGDLGALRGSSEVNLVYDFSALTVSGYPTLDDYIAYKKKKYEEVYKGEKKGEEWYQNWLANRNDVFIPRFEDVLNKKLGKCNITARQKSSARYTLIIKVTHYIETNSGFPYFIGAMSMFEAKVYLVDSSAPETKLATIRADYLNEVGDLGGSIGNFICKMLK